jgi:hypothetical protein
MSREKNDLQELTTIPAVWTNWFSITTNSSILYGVRHEPGQNYIMLNIRFTPDHARGYGVTGLLCYGGTGYGVTGYGVTGFEMKGDI